MVALPDGTACMAALEETWPALAQDRQGPFVLRDGAGGGKRVSAATATAPVSQDDIAAAEAAQRAGGMRPLFRLCPTLFAWDQPLDDALAAKGYERADPTVLMVVSVAALVEREAPGLRYFPIWPPLEIQRQIWADAGIGLARQAVMERVRGPKTALLARMDDRAAGVAFVACSNDIAMLHAMAVVPALRRKGAARNLLQGAARWADGMGARWLALAVTRANAPALALYAAQGFETVAQYHYRIAPAA